MSYSVILMIIYLSNACKKIFVLIIFFLLPFHLFADPTPTKAGGSSISVLVKGVIVNASFGAGSASNLNLVQRIASNNASNINSTNISVNVDSAVNVGGSVNFGTGATTEQNVGSIIDADTSSNTQLD